jgi:predicted SAM-dependent methyltransferase
VATSTVKQRILRVPGARPAIEAVYRTRNEAWRNVRIRRDGRRLRELSRSQSPLRLNIGASGNHLDGWLSVDLRPDDVCLGMDAARPWPLEDASAEAVNSEHFIEHLTLEQARRYLAEAYRVLCRGGLIRTTTPNLRGLTELYREGDAAVLATHIRHGYEAQTHGQMLNNYFYSWGHRQLYDAESLGVLLRDAGFVDVAEAAYGESEHELLRGIDRHGHEGLEGSVVCVDAVKPV